MLGTKMRQFDPVQLVTLDELVPADHFYRHLEQVLDLTFVRQWVEDDYAANWLYYAVHASAYTAVLFLAGIFGERPKSGKEVILATQRALEQQALGRWRMQKEAQIEDMMRRGILLGAVAAALAGPETAERTAVLEAATTGNMPALEAARLNVQRAGQDLTLLDGLRVAGKAHPAREGRSVNTGEEMEEDEREQEEVAVNGTSPLALARRR